MREAPPRVWLLFGGKAGDNNQVLALAEALGWPFEVKRLVHRPWELAANLVLRVTLAGIDRRRSSPLEPPWPDLVIAAGRRNEPVARWIRRRSGGRARLVHVGRPWAHPRCFDLVVSTPQYFLEPGPGVHLAHLPLHRITAGRLAECTERPSWAALPLPWTGVLLGGDSGPFAFTAAKARRLAALVDRLAAARGGAVVALPSRRTPPPAWDAFRASLKAPAWWPEGDTGDAYFALLATADALVVTAESMSMVAEAAATGKPLWLFDLGDAGWWGWHRHNWTVRSLSHRLAQVAAPRRLRRDVARITASLVAEGRARWLEEGVEPPPAPRPELDGEEAARAAARVRALFAADLRRPA
ncbi:MAG: nucleoside-diphosphate sugar epimerase [Porticoccaceae bacterium]|nr:MAG: nucleoside-diphosphate sugar epimerase [Porticoccaceae bacterium]